MTLAFILFTSLSIAFNGEDEGLHHQCPDMTQFIPSVTSATQDQYPQRIFWYIAIAFHSWFDIILQLGYFRLYKLSLTDSQRQSKLYNGICYLIPLMAFAENHSLIFICQRNSLHNLFLFLWAFSFMVYAGLQINMHHKTDLRKLVRRSHYVMVCQSASILGFCLVSGIALLGGLLHGNLCLYGGHIAFAIGEYFFVTFNLIFHVSTYFDFLQFSTCQIIMKIN